MHNIDSWDQNKYIIIDYIILFPILCFLCLHIYIGYIWQNEPKIEKLTALKN